MDEYIKREAAIKARGRSCNRKCAECDFAIEGDSWCNGEVFVVDLLRIPAADVAEVVRGRWELSDETPYIRKHYHPVACSNCHRAGMKGWDYCPNCGARMEES